MTEELNPETFDLDAWLEDAHLPERSCRIFSGGHLVGELEAIKQEIEDENTGGEGTLRSLEKISKLQEKYEAKLEKLASSVITVFCRALSGPEMREIKDRFDKLEQEKNWDRQTAAAKFWYAMVGQSVVAVKPLDGERREVKWTAENIEALDTKLGLGEFGKLKATYQLAQTEVKEPDADFLQKSSGANKGDTAE
ncbi:hypothetical protein [Nesterenkonia pannonica]|uniref:hypothetical protein n=1 Tax=Nesterenkonia pannonica TaxID=1548602 RepID=UPI0021649FE2|nr:hypothetical protein [Nesterenkonia pannonica]